MKVKTETGRIIDVEDYQIYTKNGETYVWYNDWKDENCMICMNEKVVAKEKILSILNEVEDNDK